MYLKIDVLYSENCNKASEYDLENQLLNRTGTDYDFEINHL